MPIIVLVFLRKNVNTVNYSQFIFTPTTEVSLKFSANMSSRWKPGAWSTAANHAEDEGLHYSGESLLEFKHVPITFLLRKMPFISDSEKYYLEHNAHRILVP
jgi:hypothetical protein